jgi:hypothetical protein
MTIINLCKHNINLDCGAVIPSSGVEARVAVKAVPVDTVVIDGKEVCIYENEYGEVVGLPEPVIGVWYVVSGQVRTALPHRLDLYSPGDLVRDEKGVVIGCRGLVRNPR